MTLATRGGNQVGLVEAIRTARPKAAAEAVRGVGSVEASGDDAGSGCISELDETKSENLQDISVSYHDTQKRPIRLPINDRPSV